MGSQLVIGIVEDEIHEGGVEVERFGEPESLLRVHDQAVVRLTVRTVGDFFLFTL